MDKIDAYRRLVLHKWGWLGQYEYSSLCITDQLDIDREVEKMQLEEKAEELLREAVERLKK